MRNLTSLDEQTDAGHQGGCGSAGVEGRRIELITDPNCQRSPKSLAAAKYLQLYYDQFLPPAVGATVNDAAQGLFAGTCYPEDRSANAIEDSAAAGTRLLGSSC